MLRAMPHYSPWRILAAVLGLLVAAYVAVDGILAPYTHTAGGGSPSAVQLTQLYTGDALLLGVAALALLCIYTATRRD
jgi:hypothetical protein